MDAFILQSVLIIWIRDRLYANMDELYSQVPQEEADPYGYGDETIYDSICYYRSTVGEWFVQRRYSNCNVFYSKLELLM